MVARYDWAAVSAASTTTERSEVDEDDEDWAAAAGGAAAAAAGEVGERRGTPTSFPTADACRRSLLSELVADVILDTVDAASVPPCSILEGRLPPSSKGTGRSELGRPDIYSGRCRRGGEWEITDISSSGSGGGADPYPREPERTVGRLLDREGRSEGGGIDSGGGSIRLLRPP